MKYPRRKLGIGLFASFALMLIGLGAYGLEEPRSSAGHLVFHTGYVLPLTRPAFLSFYQWTLRTFDGGSLPSSIDQFLTDRLWNCDGSKEFDSIVDFQIRQGSGRWGDALSRAHESLRVRIIASIMRRLDTMPAPEAVSAMVFVESLRRGDPLHKGGFSGMYSWEDSSRRSILNEDRFALAKERFKAWWSSAAEAHFSQDPLAGTELSIHAGP